MLKKRKVLTVDLGGQGARIALVEEGGKFLVDPVRHEGITSVTMLIALVAEFAQRYSPDSIAYASCGVIKDKLIVVDSPNCQWLNGANLAGLTFKKTRIRTIVFNDMEASVTGMANKYPDIGIFLALTSSSGIGAWLWDEGLVSRSELGHSTIDISQSALICGCGKPGHFEAYAGGNCIEARLRQAAKMGEITLPHGIRPAAWLDQAWDEGNDYARNFYSNVARAVGIWLANVYSGYPFKAVCYKGRMGLGMFPRVGDQILDAFYAALVPGFESLARQGGGLKIFPYEGSCVDEDSFLGAAHLALAEAA